MTHHNGSRSRKIFISALPFVSLLGIVLIVLTISSALAESPPDESGEEPFIQTSPVVIDDAVLFHVRGVKTFTAEERARAIAERIREIAGDPGVTIDSIVVVESARSTDIMTGRTRIVSIFDFDAALEGIPRQVLAGAYIEEIRTAIEKYRRDRAPENILKSVLYSFLSTAVLVVVFLILRKLYRRLRTTLESRYKARIHALKVRSVEIVQAEQIWATLTGALKILRLLLVFLILYAYLALVLSLFPWTRLLTAHLLDYVLTPLVTMGRAVLRYIPNLIFIALLVFIVRHLLKLIRLFFNGIEKGTLTISRFDPEWARPTYKIVRVLVVVFAAVVAYPYIPGSESPAFKGISLFLGVVFSLGSSSAISNIIAGYAMTYRRAFKVGDRVKIDDVTGDVVDIRLQVTHLRTVKNEEVVVPNSTILNSHVINYSSLSREKGLILHTTVTIGYDVPWRQVNALLLMAAERTQGLLKEPRPFVLHKSLDDFYITYELNAYTDTPQGMAQMYSDLHKNILDAFNEYSVQIMSPGYEGDPDRAKVVPKESWFAAPATPPDADTSEGKK